MLAGSDDCGEQELFDTFLSMVPGATPGNALEKFVMGNIKAGKKTIRVSLQHYSSSSKMSRARYLGFASADIVIFLFNMTDRLTFTDIHEEFYDDAMYARTMSTNKEVVFYLMGMNADKRSNPVSSNEVSDEEIKAMCTKLKAKAWFAVGKSNQHPELKKVIDLVLNQALKIKK